MADINHSLVKENVAATECSEFQFNANCLAGQGQLCISEPHFTEIVDNEGLAIDQLKTAEKVALEDLARTETVWEYPWKSDKVVTYLSVAHQDKNTSVKDEEGNSQSSKPINYHNNQTKNLYFCDRPKNDFQHPSLLAQHVFYASKVPMQSEQLEICTSLVPDQNSQTKNSLIIGDQCGENNQSLSHFSQYYKNELPYENSAWQDQNPQSEAGSLISEACYGSTLASVPLKAENITEYVDEAFGANAIQVTHQRTESKNLHICDQCGKEYQWLSELIQHQLLFFGGEVERQGQLHLEGRNPSHLEPVPILLQENSMCATSWETFQQKSRDHNTYANTQYLCHQSGKVLCRSSVVNWHTLPREKLNRQSESKINKPSTLSFVPHVSGNKFADSCGMSNLNSTLSSPYAGKQHNDQCGRCCHGLCAQQHLNNLELKADRGEVFHLGAYSPKGSVPISLQAEKTFSENSKIPIEQKNCAKNLYTYNCDRNNFQCHGLLVKHQLHVALGGEADTQDQFKIQAGISQFQMESKVIESSKVKPQSNLTTNQGSHIKNLGICKECGKDFRWPSALARHQVVHSGKVSKKKCPSKVVDQNDLPPGLMDFDQLSHLKTNQLTEKNKPYMCDPCGKRFKWPSDLVRHKKVHSRKKLMRSKGTKPNKSCICDQCGKYFYWPSHLAQHKRTHSRSKLMRGTNFKSCICGHCGKSYHSPSQLARHQQTHFRTKLMKGKCTKLPKSYICGQCGKNFQWPELAQHKCTHYRKELLRAKGTKLNKYYTRSQRGKSFQGPSQSAQPEHAYSRSKLVRGKCRKHKTRICDQCGKSFMYPSDLVRHKRTHSRK